MGSVQASIELYDRMSRPLNAIMNAVNHTMVSMQGLQGTMNSSMDTSSIDAARDAINDAQREVDALAQEFENAENSINNTSNAQQEFNTQLDMGVSGAQNLESAIRNVVGAIGGMMAIKEVTGFIQDATEAANAQNSAEVQLQATMRNMGNANHYDEIIKKAQDIQANGIYSDEAMIGAAAEFSTYMTDPEAIKTMMDTLTNYAAGMTGGGAVGNEEMVNFATNLGKITTGAYDAMTKKGFEFTEAQKAVLKGAATEAQYVEALGADYKKLSGDMQQAQIISDVINESWAGMYEAMSNTPEASVIQFQNAWGDLNEEIGNELYPSIETLFTTLNANLPLIKSLIEPFVEVLINIINKANEIATWMSEHEEDVQNIANAIMWVAAAYVSMQVAINACKASQEVFNAAADASPWMLLLQIIIMLAGSLLLGSQMSAQMQDSIRDLWLGIFLYGMMAWEFLSNLGNTIAGFFWGIVSNIGSFIVAAVASVVGYIADLVAMVMEALQPLLAITGQAIGGVKDFAASAHSVSDEANDYLGNHAFDMMTTSANNLASLVSGGEVYDRTLVNANRYASDFMDNFQIYGTNNPKNPNLESPDQANIDPNQHYKGIDFGNGGGVGGTIANNTGRTADALEITNENLKYLREAAETSAINRYTIAEIKVDMTNNNNISSGMDIDGVVETLSNGVQEAMEQAAEGVY